MKNRTPRLVAAMLILWLPLYGCTKVEPSSDTNNAGVAGNAGQDSSLGASVAEPVHADISPAVDSSVAKKPVEWKTFRGDYFDVQYPGSFTVESSGETDGMLFASPDHSVRFYVFSPQWNAQSKLYEADPEEEIVKQHSVEREGSRRITRVTYQRRDNHHMRSFEDVEDTLYNTRRTFGVFYSNQNAYAEYRDLYLTFKRSLKQYADH